jgi:hypothetical protein
MLSLKFMTQVNTEHYAGDVYDNKERFISYFNQKNLIFESLKNNNSSVLEIGVGNGFLKNYLTANGINVKTFDFDSTLNPDYVGDVRDIENIVKEKFDVVVCFEVLEHIPFEDFERTIKQLKDVTKNTLIVSVPQTKLYVSLWMKMSLLRPLSIYLSIPAFFRKHKFDGQHYWELGATGFGERKLKTIFKKTGLNLMKIYTDSQDPYHIYFILEK